MTSQAAFKQCTVCGDSWPDLASFVTDPELRVNGYQADFDDPEHGLVVVTHERDGCRATLAVRAVDLSVLYHGPHWAERRKGMEDCLRLCLDHTLLEECTAECDMAWVRHVLQWLRRHELPPHLGAGV